MYKRKIPVDLSCGLELAKEVLLGKWKMHILYFIGEGNKRPSELQKMIPGATRRVLNVQLNQLEEHGLVSKKVFAELPPKVEYFLTDIGKTALPVIMTLGRWGENHQDHLRGRIAYGFASDPPTM
ncbi:MAG TPA: helix-turn-helix domain-containing protein [Pyrinomonadaceae bacterium]|nr:helix-turn-helix domain-containing protein [Pyrinomonadaceae bacterium]